MDQENEQMIRRFYDAFSRLDGDAMAACYAPGASFSDPVFINLTGVEPGAMWRMLTARAKDLKVQLVDSSADGSSGTAHWIADYTFSTGRSVHNDVRAEFRFEDGLIVEHRDSFSLGTWMRQALGPVGVLLGWTPILPAKVRSQARSQLDEFLAGDR